MDIDKKLLKLRSIIIDMESIAVGYSGGVDSTLLLNIATEQLGENALGVIARSSSLPEKEYKEAVKNAADMGSRLKIIYTDEHKNPKFVNNPVNRCFFCKDELYSKLRSTADAENIKHIADGMNIDDLSDFRPGHKAQKLYKVRSPLKEAGLNKIDIRAISKKLQLNTFDKPAFACLASRFPYGTKITGDKLKKVEAAEEYLKSLGFKEIRVRHYGPTVRLEFAIKDIPRVIKNDVRNKIISKMKSLGYIYVTLDLEGFRSGSMNEILISDKEDKI